MPIPDFPIIQILPKSYASTTLIFVVCQYCILLSPRLFISGHTFNHTSLAKYLLNVT